MGLWEHPGPLTIYWAVPGLKPGSTRVYHGVYISGCTRVVTGPYHALPWYISGCTSVNQAVPACNLPGLK